MRLDELTIRAFRGIRGELRLDLTAPLTVIHADNGTGKTTICDALEWLLSHRVDRLDAPDDALRCRTAAPEMATEVAGTFGGEASACYLRRFAAGKAALKLVAGGAERDCKDGDLLAHFVPGTLKDDRKGAIQWLLGTRIFGPERVTRLVDNDQEALDTRRRMFAPMFGVEDLERKQVRLEKLRKEFPALRPMQKDKDEALLRCEQAEREAEAVSGDGGQGDELARLLGEAAAALGVEVPAEARAATSALGSIAAARSVESEAAVHNLRMVRQWWADREQRRDRIELLEAEQAGLATVRADVESDKARAAAERASAKSLLDTTDAALARVDSNLRTLESAIARARSASETLEQRRQALAAVGLDVDRLIAVGPPKLGAILDRRASLLADLQDRRDGDALTDAELLALRNAVAAAASGASPWDRFRVAAQAIMQTHVSAQCPLCAHDFLQPDVLKTAVATVLAQETEPVRLQRAETARRLRQDLGTLELALPLDVPEGALAETTDRLDRLAAARCLWDDLDVVRRELEAALSGLESLIGQQDAATNILEARRADAERLTIERAACREKLAEFDARHAKAQANLSGVAEKLVALQAQIAELRSTEDQFRAAWRTLSGQELPEDETTLVQVASQVEGQAAAVQSARLRLAAADELLRRQASLAAVDARREEVARATRRLEAWKQRHDDVSTALDLLADAKRRCIEDQLDSLRPTLSALFLRAQANPTFDGMTTAPGEQGALVFTANGAGLTLDNMLHLSQGQRQDLALAVFLARARAIGGTVFLDEALSHLDDLNRVAVLDALRVLVMERDSSVRLILTTANLAIVRHLRQKLGGVATQGGVQALRVYRLEGNAREGVRQRDITRGEAP